jgi:hypothetical protein
MYVERHSMIITQALKLLGVGIMTSMLSSCGPSPNAPGVGGVTKAQAAELNEAADALDERANEASAASSDHE